MQIHVYTLQYCYYFRQVYQYLIGMFQIILEVGCDIQCQNIQHDHHYICCDPEKKYCGEHDLLERITSLEVS